MPNGGDHSPRLRQIDGSARSVSESPGNSSDAVRSAGSARSGLPGMHGSGPDSCAPLPRPGRIHRSRVRPAASRERSPTPMQGHQEPRRDRSSDTTPRCGLAVPGPRSDLDASAIAARRQPTAVTSCLAAANSSTAAGCSPSRECAVPYAARAWKKPGDLRLNFQRSATASRRSPLSMSPNPGSSRVSAECGPTRKATRNAATAHLCSPRRAKCARRALGTSTAAMDARAATGGSQPRSTWHSDLIPHQMASPTTSPGSLTRIMRQSPVSAVPSQSGRRSWAYP